ncbi:hypothetical protein E2C01_051945 [Portunus trituberculatus]|uniref:Uncharacterized protein n=1 Tax=Portunus trituberculatus TaxID=210409 RepID=A0A5B7GKE5_PORTR|nr:hypothetical protein [Portunus trituberculatus]
MESKRGGNSFLNHNHHYRHHYHHHHHSNSHCSGEAQIPGLPCEPQERRAHYLPWLEGSPWDSSSPLKPLPASTSAHPPYDSLHSSPRPALTSLTFPSQACVSTKRDNRPRATKKKVLKRRPTEMPVPKK